MRDREELMTAGDSYPREMVVALFTKMQNKGEESVGINVKGG